MLNKKCAKKVLEEMIALFPNAEPELNFKNRYQLLVAVLLSAQTTDIAVNKVTPALFEAYPNPASLAKASPEELMPYLQTIGLYRNKAKYLHLCANQLMERHQGEIPSNRKDLEALAGVGRKTTNVVLSVGFGIPAFAVDTHIHRICLHHKIVDPGASVRQVENRVMEVVDKDQWIQAHQSLILFGRRICHPRNPECHNYPQLFTCQEEE
ncbi:endonuclease-3 [Facklamia miroungae]|uniref:Endonuclease III n=2 Tax=Facklamia miroungae TaxID=120956 RepID=A0A1G7PCH0_9LACT|nr:endonuclease-3 [Facklamia miroungae]